MHFVHFIRSEEILEIAGSLFVQIVDIRHVTTRSNQVLLERMIIEGMKFLVAYPAQAKSKR